MSALDRLTAEMYFIQSPRACPALVNTERNHLSRQENMVYSYRGVGVGVGGWRGRRIVLMYGMFTTHMHKHTRTHTCTRGHRQSVSYIRYSDGCFPRAFCLVDPGPFLFLFLFLRCSIGGVAYVTVFNSSATDFGQPHSVFGSTTSAYWLFSCFHKPPNSDMDLQDL